MTLVAEGYVKREQHGHKFRLTAQVHSLSAGYDEDEFIAQCASPIIDALGKEIRWPLALTMPVGENMMVRVATDHKSPLAIQRYYPGYTAPILHTTTGQIFLAFCSDLDRRELLKSIGSSNDDRQALAQNPNALGYILERIRVDQYRIIEHDIYPEGSLGVPVFFSGKIIGGIVLRYIKSAMKPKQLIKDYLPLLKEAALEIEHTLAENVEDNPAQLL